MLETHRSPSVSTSASLPVRHVKQTLLHEIDSLFNLVVAGGLWVYQTEQHHKEHLDHLRAENDGKLPEIPNYDHLNRRVKPFPWGMNSLFFNPAVCTTFYAIYKTFLTYLMQVNKDLEAEAE